MTRHDAPRPAWRLCTLVRALRWTARERCARELRRDAPYMSNSVSRDTGEPAGCSGPAERVLREVEVHNRSAGHENAGFLSKARGFVPLAAPQTALPAAFAAWDELAAELPSLYVSLALRERVERLPLLDASAASLADGSLLRAAALLAIVSHAYWYVDCRPPRRIPEVLSIPWAQVRARLGRQQEVLSYVDLIVYNWRTRDAGADVSELSLERLDLLLPTIGNQEERVFYLTQLEILARASAIPSLMATAQSAALREDPAAVESALAAITKDFAYSAAALDRIDPRAQGGSFVDPVRWAKTVAPLAVPFQRDVLGPSGTSSPLFNTLDAFFGRAQFDSTLGREIRQLRRTYPPAWQRFIVALEAAPVSAFVARSDNRSLRAAWEHALDGYAGRDGFLGRHRRKVYGYLELAFKVGRSLTIGGFGGAFADRTWNEVDAALVSAHAERPRAEPASQPSAAGTTPSAHALDVSEIVRHNRAERGFWLVVAGSVYDVTRFASAHPGGRFVLQAYAGLDATRGFARAHPAAERVVRTRDALRIGDVRTLAFDDAACTQAHRTAVAALYLVVEMQNALALDRSFALAPGSQPRAPYEHLRSLERHRRFLDEYVAVLETQTLPGVWACARTAVFPARPDRFGALLARVQRSEPARATWLTAREALASFRPGASSEREGARIDAFDSADARLLAELKATLRGTVRAFEVHAPRLPASGATRVERTCLRCVSALRRYYARASSGPFAVDSTR